MFQHQIGSLSGKEESKMSPSPCPIPLYLTKSRCGVEILYFYLCNKVDILKRAVYSDASQYVCHTVCISFNQIKTMQQIQISSLVLALFISPCSPTLTMFFVCLIINFSPMFQFIRLIINQVT